jgi:hypothetical protein
MGNLSDDEIESRVRALGGSDPARWPEVEAGLSAQVATSRTAGTRRRRRRPRHHAPTMRGVSHLSHPTA